MQVSITDLVALTGIHRNRLARLLQDLPCTAGAKGAKVYESVDALREERGMGVDAIFREVYRC